MKNVEFKIKKTTDLSDQEKALLLDCFVEVFEQERSMEEMYNQYINTPMGYSVHSLCFDNGSIVAAHTAFPSYYYVGDKRLKAFITGDNMVMNGYRDGSVFLDVTVGLRSFMKKDGYAFSFGFPNENAYIVNKKGKLSVDIGRLDTYILPYRIGGIKHRLAWLNCFSVFFSNLWLICSSVGAKKKIAQTLIHKDDASYNPCRYKRMDGDYIHIKTAASEFYYKIKTHEDVRTAFLIDVIGKSEKRFQSAVKYIKQKEKGNFDLILFVGHLPEGIRKIGLVKIPRKVEPKHFYMMGKIYDNSLSKEVLYDINNWDVNLSDYDLI